MQGSTLMRRSQREAPEKGFLVIYQCYKHPNAQPTPEPEETTTEGE